MTDSFQRLRSRPRALLPWHPLPENAAMTRRCQEPHVAATISDPHSVCVDTMQRPELQASGSGASAPARHPGGLRPLCPMRLRVCGGLSLTGGRPDEGQERLLKATAKRVLDDGWRFQREQTSPRESDRGPLLCRELFGEGGEFGGVFFFFLP